VAPRYDHVLLDTGAGISDVVLYTVSLADDVLVVATPEPTSLTDAYATIKVLATTQGRREAASWWSTRRAARAMAAPCAQQLQQVIDRYVSPTLDNACKLDLPGRGAQSDSAVREAVQRRQLLLLSYPGSMPRHSGGGAAGDAAFGRLMSAAHVRRLSRPARRCTYTESRSNALPFRPTAREFPVRVPRQKRGAWAASHTLRRARLVDRFYDLMDLEPAYAGSAPCTAAPGRLARQAVLVPVRLAGRARPVHEERFGHPRLRARHMPYAIGIAERDQWMACMMQAMQESRHSTRRWPRLARAFFGTADWMRNI
jgi:truncated hemoglobin YjbI